MRTNLWLIAGGGLSAAAALLHLAIIAGGPAWYRFFGAGERMAHFAEAGRAEAWLVALGIAVVLGIWSAYAFSGAGVIGRLPLLKPALVAISAIYLARAAIGLPVFGFRPDLPQAFIVWSSLIVLVIGVAYAVGTWTAWSRL